ncbi:MAG TPA: hypothetical protein EYP56_04275 [Planctomycetaceae bacterium]|nr:hypothetical protein [Planctomycetaceae bacterium]
MSNPDLAPVRRGPYRKPAADVYTALLAMALLAIIVACVCLFLETSDYGSPPYEGAPQVWTGAEGVVGATAVAVRSTAPETIPVDGAHSARGSNVYSSSVRG